MLAVKKYWTRFIFAWAVPLFLIISAGVLGKVASPQLVFLLFVCPVFFICLHVASKPVREKKVTLGQGLFWIVIVPILVWFVLIFGFFGLAHLLKVPRVV